MVTSIAAPPKGIILMSITLRCILSISHGILDINPICFLQQIFIRTFLSEILTLISAGANPQLLSEGLSRNEELLLSTISSFSKATTRS